MYGRKQSAYDMLLFFLRPARTLPSQWEKTLRASKYLFASIRKSKNKKEKKKESL